MARALWLPAVLRAAGLPVVEVAGWQNLGSSTWNPTGGIVHATADGAAANPVAEGLDDASAIGVIRNGRPGLAGPIANCYQSRAGVWHVIASGRCNTALTGTAGPLKGLGNTNLLGIEHENDNRGEPWPAAQYRSAITGWAAICRHLGWSAGRLAGHKEHDPGRKTDPYGIDMHRFRADVTAALTSNPTAQGADMDARIETWLTQWIGDQHSTNGRGLVMPTIRMDELHAKADRIIAQATADEARDQAVLTAVQALATGGGVDAAPIVAAIQQVRTDTLNAVAALQQENADLRAQLVELQATAEANLSPSERAALDGDQ